ncbi:MAG: dipeptidase, partial [Bacillota bacterium]|nr:dipeptidase [Bacillota bacterium]
QTYDSKSSYWLYKLAGVLVDSHYHEFNQLLAAVQTATHTQLLTQLAQHDVTAKTATDLTAYLNQANQKHADLARANFEALIADMVTKATDLSPLNYNTDENL